MLMPDDYERRSSSEGIVIEQLGACSHWIGHHRPERQKAIIDYRTNSHILGTLACPSPSKSRLSSPMNGSESLQAGRPLQNKSSTPSGKPRESNAKVYFPTVSFLDHAMGGRHTGTDYTKELLQSSYEPIKDYSANSNAFVRAVIMAYNAHQHLIIR